MAQPITDYAAFFDGAKQAVRELEQLKLREEQLLKLENELETSLKTKQKQVSDTISQTQKKRHAEIMNSYDKDISYLQDRLKKVRSKREKAKNQGVKERIAEDTQSLLKENADLRRQMKTLFHTNHVPRFCAGKLYYSLYFTKGLKELLTLLIVLLICFLAVPCGVYFMIPERKTMHLILIYVLSILLFGGLYVKIGNSTKIKYMDVLKQGRQILNQIAANKKKVKKITKSIRKDKDEAVYNLQKFDDEIAQLEQNMAEAERKKEDALNTFENVVKTIISDEIMGNYLAVLTQIETDLGKTIEDLKETQKAAMNKALYITDNYQVYAGKEFMSVEGLEALEELIQSGKATNLTEAITIYKSKEHQNR